MSHAQAILAILEREQRRKAIREVKYGPLHDALKRAHAEVRRGAVLIEAAEQVMSAVKP